MKQLYVVILGLVAVALGALMAPERTVYVHDTPREPVVRKYRPLDEYILDHMKSRRVKESPAAMVVRSRQFARILEAGLPDRDDQEIFVFAIGNESHYSCRATSPTGARGIAQIIPSYAQDFSRLAGLGSVSADDLYDCEIGLTLGVALFKDLLRQSGGNRALAAAYYNQGPYGATASAARSGDVSRMNNEGVGYVAKIYLVAESERVRTKQ